ncbi:MAG: protein translocase subunit SecF [Acidimicrobiales bacterium]|nr:protein translocase subunit SecF [Acidimicrobiales bacterium]
MSRLRRMYRNETALPFSAIWTKVLVVSTILVVISVLGLFIRSLNLGLEFEGGGAWEVPVTSDLEADEVRDALRPLGLADARIQTGGGVLRVRTELTEDVQDQIDKGEKDAVASITSVLAELADPKNPDTSSVSVSTAGPSWGDEITDKAVTALIVFFIIIALYITVRLRWEMAVGALIAVAHDILITVGIYALFQLEVTPATVIAFLTIMGYSLYDTLVVFDKVRDNEHRLINAKLPYREVVDQALNQVLMRSVNTSITSVLPVISVLVIGSGVMGAVTLREFALALLIGLLIGTFSSLFVAAPVATWLREKFGNEGADKSRSYRLSEAVKRRNSGASAASPQPANPSIPPRPRKNRRR